MPSGGRINIVNYFRSEREQVSQLKYRIQTRSVLYDTITIKSSVAKQMEKFWFQTILNPFLCVFSHSGTTDNLIKLFVCLL